MTDLPPAESEPGTEDEDSTARCSACSAEIPKLARLCPNCGTPVKFPQTWPPSTDQGTNEPDVNSGNVGAGVGYGCLAFIGGAILWFTLATQIPFTGVPTKENSWAMLVFVAALHIMACIQISKTRRLTAIGMGCALIMSWAVVLGVALPCINILSGI
jgi:hypothetical protein